MSKAEEAQRCHGLPEVTSSNGRCAVQPLLQPIGYVPRQSHKSILEAYLLAIPLGILGAHHFYLRRPGFGFLYFFTFGLLGVGVVVDWIRLPWLVRDANKRLDKPLFSMDNKRIDDAYVLWFVFGLLGFHRFYLGNFAQGFLCLFTLNWFGIGWVVDMFLIPYYVRKSIENSGNEEKSLPLAYALAAWPITGVLGGHHFYLGRYLFGVVYFFTLGLLGFGWLFDILRLPCLVRRVNRRIREGNPRSKKTLDDAYILWFPLGINGYHHFYLDRPLWGLLYFFTFGVFGIGWLIDLCRIPSLVKACNNNIDAKEYIIAPNSQPGGAVTSGGYNPNYQPTDYIQPHGHGAAVGYGSNGSTVGQTFGTTTTPHYNEPPPPYTG